MLALLIAVAAPVRIHLEPEDGVLSGVVLATERAGYTGRGYVTGFRKEGDHAAISFKARAGIYEVHFRYCSPSGPKGYGLKVNGAESSEIFAQTDQTWHDADGGKVELRDGENTLDITKGWGWFDVDSIDLASVTIPDLKAPPTGLSDLRATPEARRLYRALLSGYGERTLSGQYDERDCDRVNEVTGKRPAILGGDLMDYSPSRMAHGANPAGAVETWIARAKSGVILTLSWHWNAPDHLIDAEIKGGDGKLQDARWYKGFYTYASTFDVERALDHPESREYKLILSDMDSIAERLKPIQAAGIPILWRPLHEADGRWFWWGSKGPEPFKKLWRLMFTRFTQIHHLHNLIWVLSAPAKEWYPGNDVVDIFGVDAYPADPSDPQSAMWDTLQKRFNGVKPLALTEFGKVPDVERAFRFGAKWLYFVSWSGDQGAPAVQRDDLIRRYGAKRVVNYPIRY